MKQYKLSIIAIVLILLSFLVGNAYATTEGELQQQRIDTIKNYVRLLGKGDYQSIPKLFTKHAVAVSSNGESDSIDHFYEALFVKSISSPQSQLINIFNGQLKNNMMTAYYNMTWIDSKGEPESAKFVDLFIFQADSTKIKTIYVFSNTFHDNVFAAQSA